MPNAAQRFLRPEVLAKIGGLEFRARQVVEGFIGGMHRSPYHGYSVEFAEHREYVPGDDLRHLDWRVYGKSDRYYVKQYEEETNLRAHVLLDCSSSMRYPEHATSTGRMTKFEYAATVAASLAYLLIHQQDAVGLMLFDDDLRSHLPPSSNHAHLQAILAQLERARLERPTQTRALFTKLAGQLPRRSIAILISDLLSDVEEVVEGIEMLRHGNHEVIVLHVLDHDEREFPFQDNTLFEGLEAPDLAVTADPQSLRSEYLSVLGAFIERIRTACTNSRIDYVGLSTADPLDVALRRYLAQRAHLIKARA
ncbi:MAG TPA: DUF58 domain-containing protein [Phycisphaerae bacterium]|nr:DUF58 domain-containing protein [Phycisphaerae bacterium]